MTRIVLVSMWVPAGRSSEGWPIETAEVPGCTWVATVHARGFWYKGIGHTELAAKRSALKKARADREGTELERHP